MRLFEILNEDQLIGQHEGITDEWRRRMLDHARSDDQAAFTALRPSESGLPVTVYVSENRDYPAFIVDRRSGRLFRPSPHSKAYAIGKKQVTW